MFDDLYREHRDAIRRYCLRRLPVGEVDDVVSEVFSIVWRRLEAAPASGRVLPWLYAIGRAVARAARVTGRGTGAA